MKIVKALVIIIFITISLNAYTNHKNHKAFISTLKQQVDDTFVKGNKRDRHKKLQEIIQNSIDLKKISQFVMGKYWILTPEKIREDFLREYKTYFTRLCINILLTYISNSEMNIMGARKVNDKVYLINTRLSYGEDEDFINIDFKVTENNNSFLINDIIMSGISISINQRTKFNEKIGTYGIVNVIEELKFDNDL